jgi:HPt (histidine-containing phosphotransfer) domain-containing protein
MSNYQYFSVEALSQSVGGTDTELGARILYIFMEYLGELEVTVNTPRVTDSDWLALAESAHRYKTPARSVGSDMLAKTLDELEEAINNLQLDCATEITKELPQIISKTKLEIEHYLGSLEEVF